jgi:hypothetical protein
MKNLSGIRVVTLLCKNNYIFQQQLFIYIPFKKGYLAMARFKGGTMRDEIQMLTPKILRTSYKSHIFHMKSKCLYIFEIQT